MTFDARATSYCQRPSPWVLRWSREVPPGPVLDLACGSGRHTGFLALTGREVVACDIDTRQAASLSDLPNVRIVTADLEQGPWPFEKDAFAGIVVTSYLHRVHFPLYYESLAPGWLFIMETFTRANKERWGHPRRPEHFLEPGELFRLMPPEADLVAYEECETDGRTFVARTAWRKPMGA